LATSRPQIARRLQLPAGRTGALVLDVDPNGPAADALTENDVILSINGQTVSNAAEASRELQRVPSGRNARIVVWRNDRQVFVTVKKD
jgi:S1-C subfamily serine protease